jgi:hypothetical protein
MSGYKTGVCDAGPNNHSAWLFRKDFAVRSFRNKAPVLLAPFEFNIDTVFFTNLFRNLKHTLTAD